MDARRYLALASAATLAVQPVLAGAQERPCITEAEVSALVIYIVPIAIDGVRVRCGDTLSADGFLAQRAGPMLERYAALQDSVWPLAKSGFPKFVDDGADKAAMAEQFAAMPDAALRPFLDAVLVQALPSRIKLEDCGKIERVMEAMEPFDPNAVGSLVGVFASLLAKNDPQVCPADGA